MIFVTLDNVKGKKIMVNITKYTPAQLMKIFYEQEYRKMGMTVEEAHDQAHDAAMVEEWERQQGEKK